MINWCLYSEYLCCIIILSIFSFIIITRSIFDMYIFIRIVKKEQKH